MSHSDLHPTTRSRGILATSAALLLLCGGTLLAQATPSGPQFVAAQGRVLPEGGVVAVAASHNGGTPIISKLAVKEGDTVQAGATLAELTTLPVLELAVKEARQQELIAAGRSNVAQNQVSLVKKQQEVADSEVTLAEKALAEAVAALDVAEKSLVEADAQAQAQQNRLSGTWVENRRILDKDSPPAREAAQIRFEQKMLDLQRIEIATANAGAALRLQAQIEQARAAVATAQQRVLNAKIASDTSIYEQVIAEHSRDVALNEIEAAKLNTRHAELLTQTATITAPVSGTVLQVNARAGEAVSPEGLLLLADLNHLYVEAEVYIDDLRHVRIGQKASISGEAFAGEIHGTVSQIGNMVTLAEIFARDPASFTDQRVVKVRVQLQQSGSPLPTLPLNSRVLVRIDRN